MTTQEEAKAMNFERAHDAQVAIEAFADEMNRLPVKEEELSEYLIDLLADLRHWAGQNGVDYAKADKAAGEHYAAELLEEGGETHDKA